MATIQAQQVIFQITSLFRNLWNSPIYVCSFVFPVLSRTWKLLIIFCFEYLWGYPLHKHTYFACWYGPIAEHDTHLKTKYSKTNPHFLQIFRMPSSQNCNCLTWLLSDNDCIIWLLHEYRLNLTFLNCCTKKLIFFSLIAVLWLTYGVSPGMSLP